MTTIVINEKGQRVIQIDTIIFSSKRRIDWLGVETYIAPRHWELLERRKQMPYRQYRNL